MRARAVAHARVLSLVRVLLLALALCAGGARSDRDCAPGCEAVGNCNRDTGTCECPVGRTGAACETWELGACRPSAESPVVFIAVDGPPRNCACFRQIRRWAGWERGAFPKAWGHTGLHKQIDVWGGWKICYELRDTSEDQQYSDPPAEVWKSRYEWMKAGNVWSSDEHEWFAPSGEAPPTHLPLSDSRSAHDTNGPQGRPLDECPGRCNERGFCVDGACRCAIGFTGNNCSESDPSQCMFFNQCNGGACINGFCKCPAGRWGMDCTRSRAYTDEPHAMPEMARLRIYRYELPWSASAGVGTRWEEGRSDFIHVGSLYNAFVHFFDQFAGDWAVRTENPYEANLFYVPLFAYVAWSNVGDPRSNVQHVMEYIQATYPQLWARNEGRDHFMWLSGDKGACWLYDHPLQQHPIKVVHWGLQLSAEQFTETTNHGHWMSKNPVNRDYSCFKSEKDVVASPVVGKTLEVHQAAAAYEQALTDEQRQWLLLFGGSIPHPPWHAQALTGEQRQWLFFFGGSIRVEQTEYSGGARQAFYKHVVLKNHPEVKYGGDHSMFRQATFCFVPAGDGWGSRLMHAMFSACVPVIVQEHVHQPYDDVLLYETFSLRLRVSDIPNLVDILKAVPMEQIQRYREAMSKVYLAFSWHADLHGEAYKYTLMALHHKLTNLQADFYRKRRSRSMLSDGGKALPA